jgi:hypothetical protein
MKKLSLYIFLVLVFCNLSVKAETVTNKEILAKCIYVGHSMMRTTYKLIEFKINTTSKKLFNSTIWVNDGKQQEYNEYLDIINWSGTKITYAYPESGTGFIIDYGSKVFYEIYPKPKNGVTKRSECTIVNDKEDKAEKEKKIVKKKVVKEKKIAKTSKRNYVYKYALANEYAFSTQDPTTFKKLTFKEKKNINGVSKVERYSHINKNKKKTFRSFSFKAEYEDNITVEFFIEYRKNREDFKKAEIKALYFAKMYGRIPHFLKTHNKKIFVHEARGKDDSTWWVMYNKREFHITESLCQNMSKNSLCTEVMIHELAHVIQQLTGVISPSKWSKARKLDNKKYCAKYGKKNSYEDFAESILCWIGVRYKSGEIRKRKIAEINEFIPNRLKFFDEMNFNMYPYEISK